jgi:hypothetical protein
LHTRVFSGRVYSIPFGHFGSVNTILIVAAFRTCKACALFGSNCLVIITTNLDPLIDHPLLPTLQPYPCLLPFAHDVSSLHVETLCGKVLSDLLALTSPLLALLMMIQSPTTFNHIMTSTAIAASTAITSENGDQTGNHLIHISPQEAII